MTLDLNTIHVACRLSRISAGNSQTSWFRLVCAPSPILSTVVRPGPSPTQAMARAFCCKSLIVSLEMSYQQIFRRLERMPLALGSSHKTREQNQRRPPLRASFPKKDLTSSRGGNCPSTPRPWEQQLARQCHRFGNCFAQRPTAARVLSSIA